MGLDFLRATTIYFEQKRDEAHGELCFADILTRVREDVIVHHFNCLCTDPNFLWESTAAIVGRSYSDAEVRLQARGIYIGHVLAGDAEVLTDLMKKNGCGSFISLRLIKPPGIDGVFQVTSKKPFFRS